MSEYSKNISPLLMYQPNNIATILTFYSPLIITVIILSLSFIFQNFKGLGYLAFLLIFSFIRGLIMEVTGSKETTNEGGICNMVQYSKYGNATFSMFFIAFSFVYLTAPMIFNNSINYWIVSAFLFYFCLDAGIRIGSGCIQDMAQAFLNTVIGLFAGIASVMVLYSTNNQKYLFFNETSSDKDVCTTPTKSTFKCKVYKGGELIGET